MEAAELKVVRSELRDESWGGPLWPPAFVVIAILISPAIAFADAGIPMIVIMYPYMIVSIIPVILIEMWVYARMLKGTYKEAFKASALSNVTSMLFGYPLTWAILFGIEMASVYMFIGIHGEKEVVPPAGLENLWLLFGSAWLGPGVNTWHVTAAALIGLVPAFFLSVYVERWIVRRRYKESDPAVVKRAVFRANLITYCLLTIVPVAMSIFPAK